MVSVSHMPDINAVGMAVICNAWQELDQDIHGENFSVALDCCDSQPAIKYILLAATHVTLTEVNQGPNRWYDTSRRIFHDEQGVDWVRRMWQTSIKPTHDQGHVHHHPRMRDHDYGGRECIAIWEQWQLEWLLNHYCQDVQNVWYFGAGLGVRRDPFGWAQLCDLIRHRHVRPVNILAHRRGIVINLQDTDDFRSSSFDWMPWQSMPGWRACANDVFVKTDLEW